MMNLVTWQALREKEVLCVGDGRRLGYPCDLELDTVSGRICALFLPGEGSLFSLKKRGGYRVNFEDICRIGEDVILIQRYQRLNECDWEGGGRKGKRNYE